MEGSSLTGETPSYSAPATFGRFEVVHQVGAGVLGPVFLARDPERARSVAIKVFRLDITPEQAAELASQLAKIAQANLAHPSIVVPFQADVEGTVAYLAEDYVAADSLDAAIRQYGPAPVGQAVRILAGVAGALDFAAAVGVHHGALHPRDILVTPDDTRVTGLGIARALEAIDTRAPMRRPYVAPERVQRESWGAAADIYSLGMLARELLLGRNRIEQQDGADARLPEEQAVRLSAVLARATAARPADRFATCLELMAAVQDAIGGAQAAATAGAPETRARAARGRQASHDLLLPLDTAEAEAPGAGHSRLVEMDESGDQAISRVRIQSITPEVPAADLELHPRDDAAEEPSDSFDLSDLDSQLTRDARAVEDEAVPPPVPTSPAGEAAGRFLDDFGPETEAASVTHLPRPIAAADNVPEVPAALHRPEVAAGKPGESRAVPMVIMLIIGLVVGALGGYLVGSRRSHATATPQVPAAHATPTVEADRNVAPPAPTEPVPPPPSAAGPETTPAPPGVGEAPATGERAPEGTSASTRAAARSGVLVVRSSPRGTVSVNGRGRGMTPLRLRKLEPGRYTVRVTRPGYDAEERAIVLSAEHPTATVSLSLTRTDRTPATARAEFNGSLAVDSLPAGARVFLDGRLLGTTPLVAPRVPVGSHVVRVDLSGFLPWTSPIQVVSGQRVRVTASLERESR